MEETVLKVKEKKEFSGLPNSIIESVLKKSNGDVKDARKFLRKYFGVFLTNRVLRFMKSQGNGENSQYILDWHISSKKRDYKEFYSKIFDDKKEVGSVIDLGCGINGFSYRFLPKNIEYIGIEATKQLVEGMNKYFKNEKFDAQAIWGDLFNVKEVLYILKKTRNPRVVFMFQVIDALEGIKRDFSKEIIVEIMKECELLVISLPLVSLGGSKRFSVDRKWLIDFLQSRFVISKDFVLNGERVFCVRNS